MTVTIVCHRQTHQYGTIPGTLPHSLASDGPARLRPCPQKGMITGIAKHSPVHLYPSSPSAQVMLARHYPHHGIVHYLAYVGLDAKGFIHETVNHWDEYVRSQVHRQAIENFWSLLKRQLNGTDVAVGPYHMERYLDEAMFRFNHRINHTVSSRFVQALSQVVNRRLAYADLTGKEASSEA
jgi:hypothetical protein